MNGPTSDAAVDIRRAADRHQTKLDWLHGRHSFDTGVLTYGADTHHGLLVAHNHDTISPNSGFDTHPHRNMEIVSWVLGGTLTHRDSEGHSGVVHRNLAQRMTAGRGILHSEKNSARVGSSEHLPVELIQMWVVPDERDAAPSYEQFELDDADLHGRLAVVASGMPHHRDVTAIRIHNRFAALHIARLDPNQYVELPDAPYVHAYVAAGRLSLEDSATVDPGDAIRLTAGGARRLEAVEQSEVLIWEMHSTLRTRSATPDTTPPD
jgi:quercetin 2,3-dioxygenase